MFIVVSARTMKKTAGVVLLMGILVSHGMVQLNVEKHQGLLTATMIVSGSRNMKKPVKAHVDKQGNTWVCIEDLLKSLFNNSLSRRTRFAVMCYLEKLRDKIRRKDET